MRSANQPEVFAVEPHSLARYSWLDDPRLIRGTDGTSLRSGSITPELARRYHRTEYLSDAFNLPIRCIGTGPVFAGTRLYPGADSDWVLLNLTEDPLFYSSGERLVMPGTVIEDLTEVLAAGIDFDAVFIAHELPKDNLKPGQPVPLELIAPPPPPAMSRRLNRLNRMNQMVWNSLAAAAGTALEATTAVVTAAGTVAATSIMLLASYDPILFGIYLDKEHSVNGHPIGLWYYLSHWTWDSEE